MAIKNPKHPEKVTLCWSCQRACGEQMCSWAKEFKPVEGWEAIETEFEVRGKKGFRKMVQTYRVDACPLYLIDRELTDAEPKSIYASHQKSYNLMPKPIDPRDGNVAKLAYNIVALAINDYISLKKAYENNKGVKLDCCTMIPKEAVRSQMQELEKFFRSEWFGTMVDLDGNKIVELLQEKLVPRIGRE